MDIPIPWPNDDLVRSNAANVDDGDVAAAQKHVMMLRTGANICRLKVD